MHILVLKLVEAIYSSSEMHSFCSNICCDQIQLVDKCCQPFFFFPFFFLVFKKLKAINWMQSWFLCWITGLRHIWLERYSIPSSVENWSMKYEVCNSEEDGFWGKTPFRIGSIEMKHKLVRCSKSIAWSFGSCSWNNGPWSVCLFILKIACLNGALILLYLVWFVVMALLLAYTDYILFCFSFFTFWYAEHVSEPWNGCCVL